MKQFTVLSHNVFWFQGVPFLTDKPPAANMEVMKRLCALYQKIDADVICLQEIQNKETLEAVAQQMGMMSCYCPGTALTQYGGGLLWRHDRGTPTRNSQGSAVETQRMWQTLEVPGANSSIRIGNVHLPSSRQLGQERANAQRLAELEALIGSVEGGLDIIVGDFNEWPDGPVGNCLERHGYVDSAVLLGRTEVPTLLGDHRGDYAWVKRQMSGRVLRYDVLGKESLAGNVADKHYLSDHLPLWITVEETK